VKKTYFLLILLIFLGFKNSIEDITAQKHSISQEKFAILYDGFHTFIGEDFYGIFNSELSTQFSIESTNEVLTREKLSNYNTLVIPTPVEIFSGEEIQNIMNFVEEGGGLLLMGNGWYWVDYHYRPIEDFPFNQIAKEFGVTINDDVIIDPTNYHAPDGPGYTVFTSFTPHAVTKGLSEVYSLCASSLSIVGDAVPIVMGDEDSYSGYHESVYQAGESPPVAAAVKYGKGRVILLGHDCFFGDVCVHEYDNLKFGMSIIKWLSGDTSLLRITCLSGTATVYVDGRNTGQTPLEVNLKPGTHSIKITKEKYREYTFDVVLERNEAKNVDVWLQKILGALSITSTPSASVYINDDYGGTTPLSVELEEGKYDIKIEKEGYQSYIETIYLLSGDRKNMSVILELKKAKIFIGSNPDAFVYINGNYRGESPIEVELVPGDYAIEIKKESYEPYVEIIRLSPGEEKNVSIQLQRYLSYYLKYFIFVAIAVFIILVTTIYKKRKNRKEIHNLERNKKILEEMFFKKLIFEKEYEIARKEIEEQIRISRKKGTEK
jgi:hypothetical protein